VRARKAVKPSLRRILLKLAAAYVVARVPLNSALVTDACAAALRASCSAAQRGR
jgi:hypothetical protein